MSFNSARLTQIRASIKNEYEEKIKELDAFSSDLLALEKELKVLSATCPFVYSYIYQEEDLYPHSLKEYAIVWGSDIHKNRRIMFTIYESKYDIENQALSPRRIIFSKALAECEISLRWRTKDHLPSFFEKYVEIYKSKPQEFIAILHRYDDCDDSDYAAYDDCDDKE
jgi:hypothetical protein